MKKFSYIRSLFMDIKTQNKMYNLLSEKVSTPEELEALRQYRREAIHNIRKSIRSYYNRTEDQLQDSLLTGSRRRVCNGYDLHNAFTEYWIDTTPDMTDEDALSICKDEIVEIHSPYDCTGQLFTSHIRYARTPVGYAFIHVLHRDL